MNEEIRFSHEITVDLVRAVAADEFVTQAARVSTAKDRQDGAPVRGLLRTLMRERHGSPFEHGMFTFRVHAPIFVFREWMRHRAGWSYNEQSGRYTEFEPVFYVPHMNRPVVQEGRPMDYDLRQGSDRQHACVYLSTKEVCTDAWAQYQDMLKQGIAREVARMVLPVTTYSTMYATCNPRSLMHFLSLRTRDENAAHPSKPQWEIDQAAQQLEEFFGEFMPWTHQAFNAYGRVAP